MVKFIFPAFLQQEADSPVQFVQWFQHRWQRARFRHQRSTLQIQSSGIFIYHQAKRCQIGPNKKDSIPYPLVCGRSGIVHANASVVTPVAVVVVVDVVVAVVVVDVVVVAVVVVVVKQFNEDKDTFFRSIISTGNSGSSGYKKKGREYYLKGLSLHRFVIIPRT